MSTAHANTHTHTDTKASSFTRKHTSETYIKRTMKSNLFETETLQTVNETLVVAIETDFEIRTVNRVE